ncbi:hypothetical protein DFH06DRAFT_1472678 [Mycena polygramma]|nr:hypothetical protein DFH06DRAFT_1472678 [Mycena polygramma]
MVSMSMALNSSSVSLNSARDTAHLRLAELNKPIDALVAERQQVQGELDSIVYPVLDLPAEIAAHIFILSLPEESTPSQFTSPLLTQICHSWREIAVTTPNLWQSIHIDERRVPHRESRKLLEMWLHRSVNLPLSLSFASSDAVTQSLIDASLIHHRRWTLERDRALPLGRQSPAAYRTPEYRGTTNFPFFNAPMLREVWITIPRAVFDIRLPFAQLTRLKVSTFASAADCVPILRQCSDRLEHLVHEAHLLDTVTDTFNQPHRTLNGVYSLDVRYLGSSIVPYVTLPRLRQLTLAADFPAALEPFQALFSRSNCSLRQLTVAEDSNYDDKLVPAITDLTFHLQFTPVHRVITSLSLSSTLPALATLTIDAYRIRDDYDDLLDILRSRRANGTLKSFSLTLHETWAGQSLKGISLPQTVLAGFRDLADGGLQ